MRSVFAGKIIAVLRVSIGFLAILHSFDLTADTRTWRSDTTGYWSNPANWEEGVVPVAGDDVVITASGAHAVINSPSPELSSVTLAGTLTFTNWTTTLRADNVTILDGGLMTLPPAFLAGAMSNRVHVICRDMLVESGGRIDVDRRGHFSATGPGSAVESAGGAAHGGFGGRAGNVPPYGDAAAPLLPGSGGGTGSNGGDGGGCVFIQATGAVIINGSITADGGNRKGSGYDGGGSGGSVYIICNTFQGNSGVVQAKGGPTSHRGSAGGGRIAVIYNTTAQSMLPVPDVRFSVHGGSDRIWSRITGNEKSGDLGTLYFSDDRFLTTNIIHDGQIIVSGWTNWSVQSLIISNAWVRFPAENFVLDVAGDVLLTDNARLDLGGSSLTWTFHPVNGFFTFRLHNETSPPVMRAGGSLILTNSSVLQIFSAMTNDVSPDYGSLVHVKGDMVVSSESWVYPNAHMHNGGAPVFRVKNLAILSGNAGFNADVFGFQGGYGSGAGTSGRGGGGYGGIGGRAGGGPVYGSSNAPVAPGSGAYSVTSGGFGGGSVRIEADETVTLNGLITAIGGSYRNAAVYAGGGSGGGVYIRCRRLSGTDGNIEATGGHGLAGGGGGGGG